jgi:xanthine/uracil permease
MWVSIFRKSSLIALCTAVGFLAGIVLGCLIFVDFRPARMGVLPFWFTATICAGIITGLVIGVILDAIFESIRDKLEKRRPKFLRR